MCGAPLDSQLHTGLTVPIPTCRQGCYGSGEASYPALLPLLTLLPEGLITDPHSMYQLLEAVITGCTTLACDMSTSSRTLDEAISCYVECWFYLIVKVSILQVVATQKIWALSCCPRLSYIMDESSLN